VAGGAVCAIAMLTAPANINDDKRTTRFMVLLLENNFVSPGDPSR
jgi:hypothetical protein